MRCLGGVLVLTLQLVITFFGRVGRGLLARFEGLLIILVRRYVDTTERIDRYVMFLERAQ